MANKKIKTIAMCAFASLIVQQTCFAVPVLKYDYDNSTVIVSGHEDSKKRVSIQVVNPGVDLTSGTPEAFDGYFAYAGYAECDENGDYSLNIKLDGAGTKETVYKLRVNGEEFENDFSFTDKTTVDDTLESVNDATDKKTLAADLKEHSRLLGLRTYVLFDNITDDDKEAIAKKLIDGADVNSAHFTDIVNDAVTSAALRNAKTESDFAAILETYADLLPIDYEITWYKSLSETEQKNVVSRMYNEKSRAEDPESVKRLYEEAVALEAIGSVGQKSQVGDIIDYFKHLFAQYDAYDKLGEKKATLWESAIDADKSSFDVFEKSFNIWVKNDGKNPGSSSHSGGGSGSSGGGGGSWSSVGTSTGSINTTYVKPEVKQIFNDMTETSWAKESVEALYERKIVSGTGNGNFSPERAVTREEFVHMISLAMELANTGDNNKFIDNESGAWYNYGINAASNAGIINGISENIFGVGMDISRQDMAVIISRCMEYAKLVPATYKSIEYADAENIDDYAKSAVAVLTAAGILSGFEDNTFRPQESVSRAQAAVVIHRLILLTEEKR